MRAGGLALANLTLPKDKIVFMIKVITKLPNSEQSYKGKVQTHNLMINNIYDIYKKNKNKYR
jgi:hypothetical protein